MGRETEGRGEGIRRRCWWRWEQSIRRKNGKGERQGGTHSTEENEVFFSRRGFLKVLGVREKGD